MYRLQSTAYRVQASVSSRIEVRTIGLVNFFFFVGTTPYLGEHYVPICVVACLNDDDQEINHGAFGLT